MSVAHPESHYKACQTTIFAASAFGGPNVDTAAERNARADLGEHSRSDAAAHDGDEP